MRLASAELTDADCFREWGATEDVWSLTLADETPVTVRVTSSEFTPRMQLIVSDDFYLTARADVPGTLELTPTEQDDSPLGPGSYSLVVGGQRVDPRGAYELTVVATAAPQ